MPRDIAVICMCTYMNGFLPNIASNQWEIFQCSPGITHIVSARQTQLWREKEERERELLDEKRKWESIWAIQNTLNSRYRVWHRQVVPIWYPNFFPYQHSFESVYRKVFVSARSFWESIEKLKFPRNVVRKVNVS